MKPLVFVAAASLLVCSSVWAKWQIIKTDWAYESNRWAARTVATPGAGEQANVYIVTTAELGYGQDGERRLYFSILDLKGSDYCTLNGEKAEIGVAMFDKRAVKMIVWCKPLTDTKKGYLSMTPLTPAGTKYIVERLKSSSASVQFGFNELSLPISTKFFSKAWGDASSNAL